MDISPKRIYRFKGSMPTSRGITLSGSRGHSASRSSFGSNGVIKRAPHVLVRLRTSNGLRRAPKYRP